MSDSENQGAKHVDGKWEISIEPEPWDAYFYIGYEHGDTRAPMGLQEGLKYFNSLEATITTLKAQLEAAEKRAPLTRCPLCHVEPNEWVESSEPGALPLCEACALDVSGPVFAAPRALSAPASDTKGMNDAAN